MLLQERPALCRRFWLDINDAGHGWFVDDTPWEDSEFYLAGDQGEQGRIDLLTTITHELGHILGLEHEDEGVMAETLAAGERSLDASPYLAYDLFFASLDED